jgi:D-aminopeptidase
VSSPRTLGIPLGRFEPGPANAIVDVAGVRVGHATVTSDAVAGRHGEIRTGVTAVWPHEGWPWEEAVYAGVSVLNGHGELIGICQVQEYGLLRCPVLLTSSMAIGAVYDGAARWIAAQDDRQSRSNFLMPVVTEVSDLILSDNRAFPITAEHVAEALANSSAARPEEGSVGAGTGTICYDVKGGIGTASRQVAGPWGTYTVGTLVLTNYGERRNLTIGGVLLGPELETPMPPATSDGSCIVILVTDAPLLPHQLDRLATRGGVGLTRSGAFVGQTSGEISLAFSTATRLELGQVGHITIDAVADGFNPLFNPLFEATVEAVHEAVLNSMFAAETMTGLNGNTVHGLQIDQVVELLDRRGARSR